MTRGLPAFRNGPSTGYLFFWPHVFPCQLYEVLRQIQPFPCRFVQMCFRLCKSLLPFFFGIIVFVLQNIPRKAFGITAEHDVGPSPCHIGCNGNAAASPGLGDNFRFSFMIFCIQNRVRDPFFL